MKYEETRKNIIEVTSLDNKRQTVFIIKIISFVIFYNIIIRV